MPPVILITRPEPAAQHFADALRQRWGCEVRVVISPLMEIAYLEDALDLEGVKTLIFTSAHGVEAFARATGRRDIPCYAVGPATSAAAIAAGLKTIEAGGDANALYKRLVADKVNGPCLHIRGEHAAADLAGMLSAAGYATRAHVAYRQEPLLLNKDALDLMAGDAPVLLPLFSPRSAALFFKQARVRAPLLIAAISQNTAAKVPEDVATRLLVAKTPNGEGMMKALDALRRDAIQLESTYRAQ